MSNLIKEIKKAQKTTASVVVEGDYMVLPISYAKSCNRIGELIKVGIDIEEMEELLWVAIRIYQTQKETSNE